MKRQIPELNYIKGLAIISAICAHCNTLFSGQNVFTSACSLLLQNIGSFGVVCFMVVSGFLFRCEKGRILSFFKKRVITIVIPWIISAAAVYLYVHLRTADLSVMDYLHFLIGNGSYLYYLTMLFAFYLLFALLPFMRSNIALFLCEAATVVSLFFFYQLGSFSPYLNPLNWIGYFALGIHLKKYSSRLSGVFCKCLPFSWILYPVCLVVLFLQVYLGRSGGYWGVINAPVTWLGAATTAVLGIRLCRKNLLRPLNYAGNQSLFVYLWHMPIAGIVANLGSRSVLSYFCLIRPFLVLAIMLAAAFIANWILKKLKWTFLNPLLGLNTR